MGTLLHGSYHRLINTKLSVGSVILFCLGFVGGASFALFCVVVIQWLGIAKLVGLLGVR